MMEDMEMIDRFVVKKEGKFGVFFVWDRKKERKVASARLKHTKQSEQLAEKILGTVVEFFNDYDLVDGEEL